MAKLILLLAVFQFALVCYSKENPCGREHFTCGNSQCIKKEWWCDGRNDCRDNSDEADCEHIRNHYFDEWNRQRTRSGSTSCNSDQFDCQSQDFSRKKCIPIEWTCDTQHDCEDGSDEKLERCIPKRNCTTDEFKCKNGLCIPLKDVCDGIYNCSDKSDENCWREISKWDVTSNMRNKLVQYLSSHYPSSVFNQDPYRYAISLFFTKPNVFNLSNLDSEAKLIYKELDLYITMALYRNQGEQMRATDLPLYIHSQLALCSNPRNFFGTDLVDLLDKMVVKSTPGSFSPLVSLSLCNSGVELPSHHLDNLEYFLSSNSTAAFITDMKAIALLVVRCIQKTGHSLPSALNIDATLNYLKTLQMADGSFRNLRSTAIIVQAFFASEDQGIGWDLEKAVNYINTKQLDDGLFGSELMTSYLVAPILSGQTFLNLYSQDCISSWATDEERRKHLEQMSHHRSFITCSLWVGSSKDVIRSLGLRVPSNATFYDFMLLAKAEDPCFDMECVRPEGSHVHSICSRSNSMETLEYWQLFKVHNRTMTGLKDDLSNISVKNEETYVFWLTHPKDLPQA